MDLTVANQVFIAGFVLQSFLIVGSAKTLVKNSKSVLGAFALAGILLILNADKNSLLIFCTGYTIVFAALFRQQILRIINPELLIFWSLLLLYVAWIHGHNTALIVGGLLLFLNLLSLLSKTIDSKWFVRTYYYATYLGVVSAVAYYGFDIVRDSISTIAAIDGSAQFDSLILTFFAGMAATTVALNLAYLYDLVPNRGNSLSDVKETAKLYAQRYHPDPLKSPKIPLLITGAVIALSLNTMFSIVSDGWLLSVLILISSMVSPKSHNLGVGAKSRAE